MAFVSASYADVVKPALVELSIFADYRVELNIDLSLEAAMADISTRYKNTNNSPNAQQYDKLRVLAPKDLLKQFLLFEPDFLQSIKLNINGEAMQLTPSGIDIDIVGYIKRPRKTILTYSAQSTEPVKTITWQFRQGYGDSALRTQIFKKDEYNWTPWRWLRSGAPSGVIDISQAQNTSTLSRARQFVFIGFDHVIPLGWDHILFIIGMALSSLLWRKLLLLVTIFTLAHTLTLGLAMVGMVEVSVRIIESLIAFSIAYVAIENLITHQSIKRKSIVVFVFGLIHGLGFATMLKEFKMTNDNFITTLIGFNIGVELAQIVIVLSVVGMLLILRRLALDYRKLAIVPTSIIIAIIGVWWGFERLLG
ncbi:hypothetical protein CRYPA_1797 [uncultured Candidatus Thioglobus sp.]|nr:hypothetical protein CRYPA_1797 [uncultured Candidatus Thioglobus sp.]